MASKKMAANKSAKKVPSASADFNAVFEMNHFVNLFSKGVNKLAVDKMIIAIIKKRAQHERKTFVYKVSDKTLDKHSKQLVGKRYSK